MARRPFRTVLIAAVSATISLFFIFYTLRLFIVTHGLSAIRPGGEGAYIGAVAFPLIAIGFGWFARRQWRSVPRRDEHHGE